MAKRRIEPTFDQESRVKRTRQEARLKPDPSRILVVGNSQINRIVVSRIVERVGLKPVSETPLTAVRVLPLVFPSIVILDGGPDNSDCDGLKSGILALRRLSGNGLPAIILLSNRTREPEGTSLADMLNAVVAKPFTADQLQPTIQDLLEQWV